jgi:hypothetical protein
MRGDREDSVSNPENLLGLRKLTIRFFEEGMSSLYTLHRDMDDFTDSADARRRWVTEVHAFAERSHELSERWNKVFPRFEESGDVELEHPSHENNPTPRVL